MKLRDDLAAEVETARKKLPSLVLLSLLPLITLISCEKKQPAESAIPLPPIQPIAATSEDRAAYSEACERVLTHLKSPGSAKFCPVENAQISPQSDGSWFISGWVDSQNLYGALLRSQWNVKMEYDADLLTHRKITECVVY